MSKVEVNQISSQCGSTLTIGQSGDTVTLACGATQTGFGRTGTVDWDTTAKTASFTAVSGNGYFVNTTSGAITLTLPATPSAGDIVSVKDYAGTFATNNLTIARNGSNLDGNAGDKVVSTNFQNFTMVYVDGTQGWIATGSGSDTIGVVPSYVTATGGTETTCGNYKIHTFTSPGTFTVCSVGNPLGSDTVDYLVVAGGAAGGNGSPQAGGGGGAGGFRESSGAASGCYTTSPLGTCVAALPVTATGYPITVGAGGAGTCVGDSLGNSGSNSVFSTITSAGGGGGGRSQPSPSPNTTGTAGGSGGGGAGGYCGPIQPCMQGSPGGSGNTPPVSPPQGNTGGRGYDGQHNSTEGGGGGGATTVGANSAFAAGGNGGAGATSSINGTPTARAGGGGGGTNFPGSGTKGAGGSGGGGAGGDAGPGPSSGTNGTTNTGGGGGGTGGSLPASSGSGGSGIVIIRYKYQ